MTSNSASESRAQHIVVGISGGVDSAVAALELLERGHEVTGLFMKNWDDPDDPGHCSVPHDLEAARAVCEQLNIRLQQVDFTAEYWHRVFEHFLAEYAAGRTPNPDILCNREIKFGAFLAHARVLGANAIATGHYARVAQGPAGPQLMRGRDPNKDQSYFLHAIEPQALAYTRFPLGDMTKAEVRARAEAAGLVNHDRPDSTGICFIGERHFREFLSTYLPAQPGPIETPTGEHLGQHHGLMYYTLGQRQGLGIGGGAGMPGQPWYVLAKDLERNVLVVGQGHDHPKLQSKGLWTETAHWLTGAPPTLPCSAEIQVRYRQRPQPCRIEAAEGGALQVHFDQPIRAVTPGQSAVFYRGEHCLGGAIIADPLPAVTAAAAAARAVGED